MYGTIARMQIKPGSEDQLQKLSAQESANDIPGFVFQYVYRSDANPNEVFLTSGFESRDAYVANAKSAEQHARYCS